MKKQLEEIKNSAIYLFFHLKYSLVNPYDFSPGELLVTLL